MLDIVAEMRLKGGGGKSDKKVEQSFNWYFSIMYL
jgi:hypothetical protein